MRFRAKLRQPDYQQLYQYALWLLARRAYTAAELLERFGRRFVSDEELMARVLEKLQEQGLQSDALAAESLVRTHPGWGTRRLKLELTRRGVSPEVAAQVLPDDEDESERLQAVLAARLAGSGVPTELKEKQKLFAYLARRGFALDAIKQALR